VADQVHFTGGDVLIEQTLPSTITAGHTIS
jgi:hypothetical protein